MVADASFAALECLVALAPRMTCITRFRLDARLFAPAPPHRKHTPGRPRVRGVRLPSLKHVLTAPRTRWERVMVPGWYGETTRDVELVSKTALWSSHGTTLPIRWVLVRDPLGHLKPQALLCTDLTLAPVMIVQYFIQRWQVEVTFEEARRHLGLETQRQWSDRAIARTTPILIGLFSLVTLLATRLVHARTLPLHGSAWYHKATPTFSDALAAVRAELWRHQHFRMSTSRVDISKSARRLLTRLTNILSEAA